MHRYRFIAASILLSSSHALAEAPPSPADEPTNLQNVGAEASGTVDEFVGGYQDSVSIAVPPYHGIEPKLSLRYTSSGSNGYVGVGWSLDGFSTIERSSSGKGTPSYSDSDIYVLDGQELVACPPGTASPGCAAGGTHATKIESYLRIRKEGDRWLVWQKNGTKATYEPIFITNTSANHILRWGLTAIETPVLTGDQAVKYHWVRDLDKDGATLAVYPEKVTYNNGVTVELLAERSSPGITVRSDLITYGLGERPPSRGIGEMRWRLGTIEVRVGSELLRKYQLSYEMSGRTNRSLLTKVQLFGRDQKTALPALELTYDSIKSMPESSYWWDADPQPDDDKDLRLFGDFRGDRRPAMLFRQGATWSLFDGKTKGDDWLIDAPKPLGPNFDDGEDDENSRHYQYAADVNGDGMDDYLYYRKNEGWYVALAGKECTLSLGCKYRAQPPVPGAQPAVRWLDVTRPEVMNRGVAEGNELIPRWLNQYVADFNGDGRADLAYYAAGWRVALSTGAGFADPRLWAGPETADNPKCDQRLGDFNNDGRSDLLYFKDSIDGTDADDGWYVALSTGSGFVESVWLSADKKPRQEFGQFNCHNNQQVGDFNGDGLSDLMYIVQGDAADSLLKSLIYVALSTGSTFQTGVWLRFGSIPWNFNVASVRDLNGDGAADLAFWGYTRDKRRMDEQLLGYDVTLDGSDLKHRGWFGVFSSRAESGSGSAFNGFTVTMEPITIRKQWMADVLVSRSNGYGATTKIEYGFTWEYQRCNWAAMPGRCLAGNNPPVAPVVKKLTVKSGFKSSATTYEYSGGLYDRENRRSLGFGYVKQVLPRIADSGYDPYQETWFAQSYGSLAKPKEIHAGRMDGSALTVLSRTKIAYEENDDVIPYTSLETGRTSWSYGETDGTVAITHRGRLCGVPARACYDAYGNLKQETEYGDVTYSEPEGPWVDVSAADNRTTRIEITPNTDAYIVALPYQTTVTSGSGSVLSRSLLTYDNQASSTDSPKKGLLTRTQELLTSSGPDQYLARTTEYDDYGNIKAEVDEVLNRTEYEYDDARHVFPKKTKNAKGQTTTTTWDLVCGTVKTSEDPNGLKTAYTYDDLCRLKQTDLPGGNFETKTYCGEKKAPKCGLPSSQHTKTERPLPPGFKAKDRHTTREYFDGLGRVWKTATRGPSKDIITETEFNERGKPRKVSNPRFDGEAAQWTTTDYDALDRLIKVTTPDGKITRTSYGARSVAETDQLGHTQTRTVDAFGLLATFRETKNTEVLTTRYEYDGRGNLRDVYDPAGNHWHYEFDSLGRKRLVDDPDAGLWTFEYYANGLLWQQTDAEGRHIRFTYDKLGRQQTKDVRTKDDSASESLVTWEYDAGEKGIGRLSRMLEPGTREEYEYDDAGRLKKTTRFMPGDKNYAFEHDYDTAGRLLRTKYPGGALLEYTYNAAGWVASIPGFIKTAEYDAAGRVTRYDSANDTRTKRTYSAQRGWLTAIATETTKGPKKWIQDIDLGDRDDEGKLRSRKSRWSGVSGMKEENWAYGYGDGGLHRLTSAKKNGGTPLVYTYDNLGNILSSPYGTYAYGSARPHAVTEVKVAPHCEPIAGCE